MENDLKYILSMLKNCKPGQLEEIAETLTSAYQVSCEGVVTDEDYQDVMQITYAALENVCTTNESVNRVLTNFNS